MSFGVTDSGFARKTLAQVLESLENGWRGIFGANVDVSASTPDGQILGLMAGALDEAWQAAAAVYASFRPSQATGAALSEIVQFNGITRKVGTPSLAAIVVTTAGGINLNSTHRFATTSGDQFAPFFPGSYGNGSTVLLRAIEKGPISVGIGALNQILTPVANLISITNPAVNSFTGTFDESDADLRARRAVSTEAGSTNLMEALYSALLNLEGVSDVRIYENRTDATVDGRPPHCFEVVILGGTNAEIAFAIWANHPAGITIHGVTTQNIVDSQGNTQAIKFTRPTLVPIYIDVTIAPTSAYPTTGNADMQQAILDYAAGLLVPGEKIGIGDDVLVSRIYTPVNSVPGHHAITLKVDDVFPPVSSADIVIDENQIASFVLANIVVHS